jgi:hypothetical protein
VELTQPYYYTAKKSFDLTGIYHEDIANAGDAVTSGFIPLPKTRRVTFMGKIGFFRD